MTGAELKKQAIEWFGGKGWQAKLAELLGINRTTLWRMITNDRVTGPVQRAVECWQAHGLPARKGASHAVLVETGKPVSFADVRAAMQKLDKGAGDDG